MKKQWVYQGKKKKQSVRPEEGRLLLHESETLNPIKKGCRIMRQPFLCPETSLLNRVDFGLRVDGDAVLVENLKTGLAVGKTEYNQCVVAFAVVEGVKVLD